MYRVVVVQYRKQVSRPFTLVVIMCLVFVTPRLFQTLKNHPESKNKTAKGFQQNGPLMP